MGTAALLVFLGSLAVFLLCLAVLARSGLLIYRTLQCAYRDFRAWAGLFEEWASRLGQGLHDMEGRVGSISAQGREILETTEDIRDALEEMRQSPLIRAARLLGRRRRA